MSDPRFVPEPTRQIPHELERRGADLVVTFLIPGVHKGDIRVRDWGGILQVKAKKSVRVQPRGPSEPFERKVLSMSSAELRLPKGVQLRSHFSDGKLQVVLRPPKPLMADSKQHCPAHYDARERTSPDEKSLQCDMSAESVSECEDRCPSSPPLSTASTDPDQRQLIAASQRRLYAIAEAVEDIRREHEAVAFRHGDDPEDVVEKSRKYYIELLLQQTLALDGVESHGDSNLRAQRKKMISGVQCLQHSLDELAAAEKALTKAPAEEAQT